MTSWEQANFLKEHRFPAPEPIPCAGVRNAGKNPQEAPLTSKSHFAAQKHEFFEVPIRV
jgi:hypothetical protein